MPKVGVAASEIPAARLTRWDHLPRVSISAIGETAQSILSDLSQQAQVSVIIPQQALEKTVTLELLDVSADRAFRAIADAMGMALSYDGAVVSFRSSNDVETYPVVVDPGYYTPEDAAQVLSATLGQSATVSIVDGRVIVSAPEDQHDRVKSMEAKFAYGQDSWAVHVMLFEVSKTASQAFGIDYAAAAGLTLEAGLGLGDSELSNTGRVDLSGLVTALLEADAGSSDVELVMSSVLHLVEGSAARLQRGDVIRVENRVVSAEGYVTTTGYQTIDTGLTIDVTGRRVPGGIRLDIKPSISDVVGFVGSVPTVSERSIESTVVLQSGGYAVLTGLDSWRSAAERDETGMPLSYRSGEQSDLSLYVVIRAIRTAAAEPPAWDRQP